MATPRVFVSSTFYDLRQVRADLELFIREMGYEPVLHERGGVPYGSTEKLEEYAYKEAELADILVSIVGGRFGTAAQHNEQSISQEELRRALAKNIQVYIFVEQQVLTEYQTYRANKGVKEISWRFVDDQRVYEHLERIYGLPMNNVIQGFETAGDITRFLKLQWAGLFHRFLQNETKAKELSALESLQTTVAALDRVASFLTSERKDHAVSEILNSSHPLFARLRSALSVKYPIFFQTLGELNRWLIDAQGFRTVGKDVWDDPNHREWARRGEYLKVSLSLFDEHGRLKPMAPNDPLPDDGVELNPLLNDPLDALGEPIEPNEERAPAT